MGDTILRMSKGMLENTISQCETAPDSCYCFKNPIEDIIPLPNPPANRRDNQHLNILPTHNYRRPDLQQQRGGRDKHHVLLALADETRCLQFINIIGSVIMPSITNGRKR